MALRHKAPDVGKIHRKSALRGIWLEDTKHRTLAKYTEKALSRHMALRHKAPDVGKIHRKSALRNTWL